MNREFLNKTHGALHDQMGKKKYMLFYVSNLAKQIVQQDNEKNKKIYLLSQCLEPSEKLGLEHIGP